MPEYGGSLTADAIVLRTSEGSRTADGILRKLVFSDDFNRTVAKGLGGSWSWYWYDSYDSVSSDTGYAFVADGAAQLISPWEGYVYESHVGFPVPENGEILFDFWTGSSSAWVAAKPTYGWTLDVTNYVGIYIAPSSTPTTWIAETWTANDPTYSFIPTQNTWYRCRHRWTTSGLKTRIWKVGDEEPATWDINNPDDVYDFAGDTNTPPFLDLYYSFVGRTQSMKVTNIEIWSLSDMWPQYRGAPIDAKIKEGTIFPLTANAIVGRTVGDGTSSIPQYASIATAISNGATNLVISKPSGTASGDTLIAIISFDAQGSTTRDMVPDPAGWISIGKSTPANGDHSVTFWKRAAGSSEPSSYTFNVSPTASVQSSGSILRVTNPVGEVLLWTKAVSFDNTVHPVPATGSGPTTPGPDIYSSIPGLLIYAAGGSVSGATWTPPTGMTERADIRSSSWSSLEVATEDVAGPFIGTRSATSSFSVIDVLGLLLLLPTGRFMSADAEFLAHRFSADAVIFPKDAGHLGAVIKKTVVPYASTVVDDGASLLYRMDDTNATDFIVYDYVAGQWGWVTSFIDVDIYRYGKVANITKGSTAAGPSLLTAWQWKARGSSDATWIAVPNYYQRASSKVSVEAWIKTSQGTSFPIWNGTNQPVSNDGGAGDGVSLWMTPTQMQLSIRGGPTVTTNGTALNDGQWHHVVGVWDGTDGVAASASQLKIYVDGTLRSTTSSGSDGPVAPLTGNPGGATIAGWGTYNSNYQLEGYIDEVAHYNYVALSSVQVADHYHKGVGDYVPDLFSSAVIKRLDTKRDVTIGSFIVSPYRTTHSRGMPPHYDNDLDTVIEIAEAIGVYARGSTVHDVLVGIYDRLAAIEYIDNIPVARHSVDTRLGSLGLEAILRRESAASVSAQSIVSGTQSGSFAIDAQVTGTRSGFWLVDSIILRGMEPTAILANGVVRRSAQSSMGADAVIAASGGVFDTSIFDPDIFE